MPGLISERKRTKESNMCFTISPQQDRSFISKGSPRSRSKVASDNHVPILPGLPDDVAELCLSLVPRTNFPAMAAVSKRWRSFIQSEEFMTIREQAGMLEEWLYMLTMDDAGESRWEVLDCLGNKHHVLPPMPSELKAGFGVVVLHGKLLLLAGCIVSEAGASATSDVYQYDSCLNSWSKLASMNVARYHFACAEVNGLVYAIGGYGEEGESLSSAEVYDPETDKWTVIEPLRRPRWGCFACGFKGKLYVMGGRSSFTIGNSKFVDVYDPIKQSWCEMKNGCVMVIAHAVLDKKLYCIEWKDQRKLSIFNPEANSWEMAPVPLTGSLSIGFQFGILDGKLLLFSLREEPGYRTLLFDPEAPSGSKWKTSNIKPSGSCLCSVTIKA